MKKLGLISVAALLALAPFAVSADEGGVPNENAYTQTGNGDPNGRKGTCIPPGSLFSQSAKEEGPNEYYGGPPGQGVKNECTPNAPS
ncbi:hypothetical protein [Thalassovita mangrovi]|uniref:Secreted protein n=1 Tax=Thalassovita mangrovi TaxID=2692236 RepID=A0A6L8LLU0_9RHOB|nr:hypothetical protein [Thalassovita mangrovi]MYM54089.1 hypothetical protein [Thalassovita mangrovi]